ncbi:MAG: hypothetical protein GFH27_549409n40 [Chloroflexi bacterium AL-W]|nr:hypothetical protein [Chloroflexi bacterium AL-N1]NOK71375.1 hypothetical protein [Chloroflexi bacterium AL-N10]NOK78778.1 hypothetical protein [Chloroflexi bacterium AL-N5]NOK86148.1 hypothetical protein [Chloroflexi bacterium AL-W]NOK93101.1 hypothetical protein [Chloroflexi bacterium AL-N15]
MDIGDMLEMMRDPLGAPFYPPGIQLLLVVTFVLHIFFVTLALGSSAFSIYGFFHKGDYQIRLARVTARLTTNAVGLGIVTGIAPLLFLQTIYDPIWYASNALSGLWSVGFIFIVMGGYGLAYLFYLKGNQDGKLLWSAIASFVLLFFAGWIMHVLNSVSMHPEKWMEWYAPNGIVDTRGVQFHAFNVPRLIFLLPLQATLSFSVVLLLFSWYFCRREDAEPAFLSWVAHLGRKLGLIVSPLFALFGVLWAFTQGQEFGIALPIGITLGGLGVALFFYFRSLSKPIEKAPQALGVWVAVLLTVAVVREAIRVVSLARFGYSITEYPYIMDWGSVLVFTVTSVVGIAVLAYLIMVLYQSGAGKNGGTVSVGVDRLGKISTGMIGAWFVFFLILGLYSTFVLG